MYNNIARFEDRAAWLGYLGVLPFLAGVALLLQAPGNETVLSGVQNYAAVIFTFVGAIHWGRALETRDPGLLGLSIVPSLVAWSGLFMATAYALPLYIIGFLTLLYFDYPQYRATVWFRRLRLQLTLTICLLLTISWLFAL